MSSRKRSRDALQVDDDVDIESASSSLRQSTQKRSRTVLAAERGGSTVSDDDDDEDIPDTLSRLGSMLPETRVYSDDDETMEVDELRSTQFVERQMRTIRENVEMENGIIEEVFCRNFMCHSKLRIKLGPLINFIIGHNGSGKSAVMTALTMCLGAKASSTNRGSSLKSMIKEGQDTATLAVKIKNQGDGAYKPDLYGRSIIVERHFTRAGTSGFKIKNAHEGIVSTKKRDLDDIVDYFGLQLDNPINVLNQDMARQFLSNSTASDKYKFFIRGTQLETLDADYNLLEESVNELETRLVDREEDIRGLQAEAKVAEDRKKRLEASDSIRLEVQKTMRMHAWAQVEEQERLLEKCTEQVTIAETHLERVQHEAESAAGEFEAREHAHEQATNLAIELQNELEPATIELNGVQDEFTQGRNRLMEMQSNVRNSKQDYKNEQTKRVKLEADIRAERELLADADGHEHTQRLERLDQLKSDLEIAHQDRTAHEGTLPVLEEARLTAAKALEGAGTPIEEHKGIVERAEAALHNLQRVQSQRFNGYRRNTDRVVQLIDCETGWKSKPVGPFGNYLKLKKPEWMGLIEKTLGGSLEQFAVTCREDQQRLMELMKRAGYTPASVVIGDATPLDTTGKEPEGNVDTILRVVNIDNDLVRNQLIINQAIEQIVLIQDRQQGYRYYAAESRPLNVKAVIVMADDRKGGGVRYDWSRFGGQRSSSIQTWQGASRMQTSREEQIALAMDRVAVAKRDLDRSVQEFRRVRQQHETSKQAVEMGKRVRTAKIRAVQQLTDDIDVLKAEIDNNRPKDGRLQELERQLEAAKDAEEVQKNIVQDLVEQKVNLDETQRDLKARLDEITERVRGHEQRVEDATNQSRQLAEKRMAALKKKNEAFAAINDRKSEIQTRINERDAQQKILDEDFVSNAEKVCPRIPVDAGMTPTKLDEKLERFQKDLEHAQEAAGGTLEELTMAWRESRAAMNQAYKEYTNLKDLGIQLKASLGERRHRWKEFRKWISCRARSSFTYLLSERNFRGNIIMDHKDKMLDLSVEPDLTRQSAAGREARTLSGGEKSFSTICLLLSIWEAMGSPIRCLDEFDVFMDSANRSMSMSMMIKAARRAVGRQFILITPQSMQDVELGDDVRIHRMSDPERGQQALPFTQA
ncbi:hypothetical protein AMS68_006100 [Peltaster fructicola]|uniref:RecF/RecN/SMC N-terminal domain-containing protein n=1 Tax=Peltaster fructicola TaxID=286661 RepID=A0A6H0Y0P7_9PEZI|nr:hypothetical protein AMS68_006100 [Peltaster fructicola]